MEYLNAFGKEGQIINTEERNKLLNEIRAQSQAKGDAPWAVDVVHLLLVNKAGELYIVKRGNKTENPYLWGKSVGGHVPHDESPTEAMQREIQEEIGVEAVIVSLEEYHEILLDKDLRKQAVVKAVDFWPWQKSIRTTRKGEQWVKRQRTTVFVGRYDGDVEFVDGEAEAIRMVQPTQLIKEIEAKPQDYTKGLKALVENYQVFLR